MSDVARYTVYGDAACEARIAQDLDFVTGEIRRLIGEEVLTAIVLTGGYGRGEGGIQDLCGVVTPHNNYDLLLVLKRSHPWCKPGLRMRLVDLRTTLRYYVPVDIDFSVISENELQIAPFRLLLCDARHASRVLWGNPMVMNTLPHMALDEVPMIEGLWLLVNRGTLLLINRFEYLNNGIPLDEVRRKVVLRHIAKAVLGCGDAVLIGLGYYHWSYLEKRRRLEDLEAGEQCPVPGLCKAYTDALEWRLAPDHGGRDASSVHHAQREALELASWTHLWFERRRLGLENLTWDDYPQAFADCLPSLRRAYAETRTSGGAIYPVAAAAYALAVGVKELGISQVCAAGIRWLPVHPRERLLCAFPGLAYSPDSPRMITGPLLGLRVSDPMDLSKRYLRLWRHFCA